MKNKITYLPILSLTLVTALSAFALTTGDAKAEVSKNTVVTVPDACSFTTSGFEWTVSAVGGQSYNTENETKSASVTCNEPSGFVIKAVGKNGDTVSTNLTGASTGLNIATNTSGTNSYWAFKVSSATSSSTSPSIAAGYDGYHVVPGEATEIISYPGSATAVVTGSFRTDYKISISTTQAADTYTGGVQYTIVPN